MDLTSGSISAYRHRISRTKKLFAEDTFPPRTRSYEHARRHALAQYDSVTTPRGVDNDDERPNPPRYTSPNEAEREAAIVEHVWEAMVRENWQNQTGFNLVFSCAPENLPRGRGISTYIQKENDQPTLVSQASGQGQEYSPSYATRALFFDSRLDSRVLRSLLLDDRTAS